MYCFVGNTNGYGLKRSLYPPCLKTTPSFNLTNQLFCFNVATNCWEWPTVEGHIPIPRCFHSSVINEDTVFLFGGLSNGIDPALVGEEKYLNNLHTLDMTSMRWKVIHNSSPMFMLPQGSSHHTLTRISASSAVLFGCSKSENDEFGDCWLLDFDKAKAAADSDFIWTNIHRAWGHSARSFHTAVVEPLSQKLWLLGGKSDIEFEEVVIHIPPLRTLAKSSQVPEEIRSEIRAFLSIPWTVKAFKVKSRTHISESVHNSLIRQEELQIATHREADRPWRRRKHQQPWRTEKCPPFQNWPEIDEDMIWMSHMTHRWGTHRASTVTMRKQFTLISVSCSTERGGN